MGAFDLVKATVREFLDDRCPSMAAAIAYYSVFALPPLLILVLTLIGTMADADDAQARIVGEVRALVGADAGELVQSMIRAGAKQRSGAAAVLGGLALLFGATGAFMQLQAALNDAWDVPHEQRASGIRGMLLKRVLSLGMVLAIGFLLLVSMMLSALLAAAGDVAALLLPAAWSGTLLRVAQVGVSLVLMTVLFSAIFQVLPDVRIAWRDVLLGGFATALLFEAGKLVLSIYLGHSEPGSAFGAAGALAALLVWIYYSAIILLLGAEFTQVWTRRRGSSAAGASAAVPRGSGTSAR